MKKILALLLALIMTAACFTALAEGTEEADALAIDNAKPFIDFDIDPEKLPEGYQYQVDEQGGSVIAYFYKESDPDAAIFYVSAAYSEEFAGYSFDHDLTDEELEELSTLLTEDYNEPVVEIRDTDYGLKLIVITENDAESDYADMITVWNGYFLYIGAQKTGQLTDEDMTLASQIMSQIWFVE